MKPTLILLSCIVWLCVSDISTTLDDEGKDLGPSDATENDNTDLETKCLEQSDYCDSTEDSADDDHKDLAVITDNENWDIFTKTYEAFKSGVSSGVTTVINGGDQLFSTVSNLSSELAEKVKKIIKEEFFDLLQIGITKILNKKTAKGEQYIIWPNKNITQLGNLMEHVIFVQSKN